MFNKTEILEESVADLRRDMAVISRKLDETANDLRQQTGRVPFGGIVWESLGLLLVVVGLALQAFGFVVGPSS